MAPCPPHPLDLLLINAHLMSLDLGLAQMHVTYFYRPQRSCGQGNIFTPVCHSVHRGEGVCLSACWDTTPPGADTPQEQTPPGPDPPSRHPPRTRPPQNRHPHRTRLQHTVYERPVRILLECILVLLCFYTCL